MPIELKLSLATLYGFVLVLGRVGGAVSFVPIPGIKGASPVARIVLAVGLTVALAPVWPEVAVPELRIGVLAAWMMAEVAFGATVGLGVAFLNEAFVLASQIFGLQAGYGYASTIDPATEADSSVLQIFTHLAAALLFFSFGMDRQVIRIFAGSLDTYPPGTYLLSLASAKPILELGATMFATALRLALPVVALLMLVDISLALLGRINQQLQLLMLSFPVKMLVSMALLATIAVLFPFLYQSAAEPTIRVLRAVLSPAR
jgi:flagellar biosynthetic protein FliR